MRPVKVRNTAMHDQLARQIFAAIMSAINEGLEDADAVCVAASVASDIGRHFHGDSYCFALADVVIARAGEPPSVEMVQ